ncbi:hypothetical protein PG984_005621 [Apiospora sp. TS-2023a]
MARINTSGGVVDVNYISSCLNTKMDMSSTTTTTNDTTTTAFNLSVSGPTRTFIRIYGESTGPANTNTGSTAYVKSSENSLPSYSECCDDHSSDSSSDACTASELTEIFVFPDASGAFGPSGPHSFKTNSSAAGSSTAGSSTAGSSTAGSSTAGSSTAGSSKTGSSRSSSSYKTSSSSYSTGTSGSSSSSRSSKTSDSGTYVTAPSCLSGSYVTAPSGSSGNKPMPPLPVTKGDKSTAGSKASSRRDDGDDCAKPKKSKSKDVTVINYGRKTLEVPNKYVDKKGRKRTISPFTQMMMKYVVT